MNRVWGLIVVLTPLFAAADVVVPVEAVKNYVNVRQSQDANSDVVGRLSQGSSLTLVATSGDWYEVELSDEATGFVSADWAMVLEEPALPEDNGGEAIADVADNQPLPTVEPDGDDSEQVQEEVPTVTEEPSLAAKEQKAVGTLDTDPVVAAADNTPVVSEQNDAEQPVSEPVSTEQAEAPVVPTDVSGSTNIKGSIGYLTRFTAPTKAGSSIVYDDGNNIGIGTTEPVQRLEVNGNIQIHEQNSSVAGLMITQSDGETGYIMHNRASTLTIGAGSIDRITIDGDGNVGIGVARPSHPLEMASGAHVTAGGVWTNSSSRARKENIEELEASEALQALAELQPVQFNYRNDPAERYVGFIAEDVPELAAMRDRDSLSAMDIVAILTKVVQEQQQQIEALEAHLDQR